jgi:hypothetical protein
MVNQQAAQTSRQIGRWARISLRGLFVLMTVAAISVGLFIKDIRDHRAAIAAVEGSHAGIATLKPSGPDWLRRFVGDDRYFWKPVAVRFSSAHPITDAELRSLMPHLLEFDELDYINLYRSNVTDAGIIELLPLSPKLEAIDVRSTSVSDKSVSVLTQFPRLTLLRVQGSAITDHGRDEIRKALPNCKFDVP